MYSFWHKLTPLVYRSAADNGDTDSQNNLGNLLADSGRTEEAEKYYRMAADKGDIMAKANLGVLFYENKGDIVNSEKYLLMAAESGDKQAMFNLGYLYEHTDRPSEAEKYYLKALENGFEDAEKALDELRKKK